MKAIVTTANDDGTYDEVGMKNRFVTKYYEGSHGLFRWGIKDTCARARRIEVFGGNSIHGKPLKVLYVEANKSAKQVAIQNSMGGSGIVVTKNTNGW